jgi:hypothetical protein
MRWLAGTPDRMHASMDVRAPLRRSNDLVIEALDDELLVYDRTNKRAHCLNADAVRVWRACDGKTDAGRMSAELDLPLDLVRQALDELEASGLLDQGLELVNVGSGNGNGKAVTRRELAVCSAKVGTAALTAPLILSITAPTAMAAATPTPFQCAVYTMDPGCDQCKTIAGCCCCCQGSLGSCKVCAPTSSCQASTYPCPAFFGELGTGNCSVVGSGGTPTPQGCCGSNTGSGCGCAYDSVGIARGGGGPGTGSGCCDTSTPGPPFATCVPGATGTCVPCCNGVPLTATAAFGCCNAANPSLSTC